jgi:hypothetical protein
MPTPSSTTSKSTDRNSAHSTMNQSHFAAFSGGQTVEHNIKVKLLMSALFTMHLIYTRHSHTRQTGRNRSNMTMPLHQQNYYVHCPFAVPPSPMSASLFALVFNTGLHVSNCLALSLILHFPNVPSSTPASEPGLVEETLRKQSAST